MAKLDIAAAIHKYERTIRGTPSELNHGTRYMVTDHSGNVVFESHDANQAEGVRMRTIGSRTVVYDPTKVIGGGPMESLERQAVSSSPLVESTEANSNTCPVCEDESGDNEYCTSCGSEMTAESEDFDEAEIDEADVPASTKRGGRRIATGAALGAGAAYALGAKGSGLSRAASAGAVGGYVHHRRSEKAKSKALALKKEDYNLDEMSKENRLKFAKAKGFVKGHAKSIAIKSGGAAKKGVLAAAKHLGQHGDKYALAAGAYSVGRAVGDVAHADDKDRRTKASRQTPSGKERSRS